MSNFLEETGANIGGRRLIFEFAEIFLQEGQVLLEGLFELPFNHLSHGAAFEEGGIPGGGGQLSLQLEQFFGCGQALVAGHDIQQLHQPETGRGYAKGHHGPFLRLVLFDGIFVKVPEAEFDKGPVLFEELGDIEIFSTLIGLLVEVDGADPVLIIFDIGGDIDDEIVGAHISEETHETAFVKLDEFFGEADLIGLGVVDEVLDE